MHASQRIVDLLHASHGREILGGHQGRVFLVTHHDGSRVIAKLRDANLVEREELEIRMAAVAQLAESSELVCRPIPTHGRLVLDFELGDQRSSLLTCFGYAGGRKLDIRDPRDATAMGRTLWTLHHSMRRIQSLHLPIVAPLRANWTEPAVNYQMLHGDFNAGNLRRDPHSLKVFDFDDCGLGPTEFDLANAIYMVMFDAMTNHGRESHRAFQAALLSGYGEGGGTADLNLLQRLIAQRVTALEHWLDHPEGAPIGIRTASPEWRRVLRTFVAGFRNEPIH